MITGVSITTLGGLRIARNGEAVLGLASRKAEGLLVYLACTRRPHARELLADLLWDDTPRRRALANLSVLLSSIRQQLGGLLQTSAQSVAIDPSAECRVDAIELAALVEGALARGGPPLPPDAAEALERALALYGGEFLHGFLLRDGLGFESWALAEQARLRQMAIAAHAALIATASATGALDAGIAHAARLLQIDPLHEPAHQQMLALLARSGQRGAALAHYERYRQLLDHELGAAPSPEVLALAQEIRSGMPGPGAARPAAPGASSTLSPHAAPFVGRADDLAALRERLADPGCRLLTLVGPGGIGKTRLAIAAAEAERERMPHGAALVSLAAVGEPGEVATAIGQALGVTFGGQLAPQAQLIAYLQDRRQLLLLDTFEHLLAGAPLIGALLDAAPGLRLLVTSRERLNLRAEWLYELSGLRYPEEPQSAAEIDGSDAIQLFAQQARRVAPGFALTEEVRRDALRLCQLVGGMPLAIELAAAWMHRMTCGQIVAAIGQNLDALATGLRDAPARHRSIRAVFDHSWQLLEPGEQGMFQRLAVFRGSFTREAAAAVGAAMAAPMADVALQALCDKSLVRYRGGGRYDLHELARQYALQRLSEDGGRLMEARERHARHYQGESQRLVQRYAGSEQRRVLEELAAEVDNLRAAWEWAAAAGRADALLAMLPGLVLLYDGRSRYQDAYDLLEQTCAQLAPGEPGAQRALGVLLAHQGLFCERLGRYAAGIALAQRSLDLLGREAPEREVAHAWGVHGRLLERQALYEDALRSYERSLAIARAIGDRHTVATALYNIGSAREGLRDYAAARATTQESLALFTELGDRRRSAFALNNLGVIAEMLEEYDVAIGLYHESLALFTDLGDSWMILLPLSNLGDVATTREDHRAAWSYYQQGLQVASRRRITPMVLMLLVKASLLLARVGSLELAIQAALLPTTHPATAQDFRAQALHLLEELGAQIPAARAAALRAAAAASSVDEIAQRLIGHTLDDRA